MRHWISSDMPLRSLRIYTELFYQELQKNFLHNEKAVYDSIHSFPQGD